MAIPFTLPPSGRMAIVHADVEGGTRLDERVPDVMRRALELLDGHLRRALLRSAGHELRSIGHTFVGAWQKPADALAWCLEVQQELIELNWPLGLLEQAEAGVVRAQGSEDVLHRGLRVRMGMHVGTPGVREDRRTRKPSYHGPALLHAARVAAAGHGGQVVLSGAAWSELEGGLGQGVVARALGTHRLPGHHAGEELVEILPRALAEREFPAPRTLGVLRTNLRPDRPGFVGRDPDRAALGELFGLGVRMVSVTGASGIGKTRLCERFALDALDAHPGGVWWCDVSRARSLDGLLHAVGSALDVPVTLGRGIEESVRQLGHAIAARERVLLVLDDADRAERFVGDTLRAWSRRAPDARFLVTSREPVGCPGEVVYRLGPLPLPEEGAAGSVRLFEAVARAVRPSFRLGGPELELVYEIVRILGGVPLAIELVASQMHVHSPSDVLRELSQHAVGRTPGATSHPEQGLAVALDWAWEQLSFWERDAAAQCAVFREGFDVDAAQEVLDLSEHPSAPWVGDVLHTLLERRLFRWADRAEAPGEQRWGVHKSIARYASRRLPQVQREAAELRHAAHYLGLAQRWASEAWRAAGGEVISWLELEQDNLLAVHRRGLKAAPPDRMGVERALRAIVSLEPLFSRQGPLQMQLELLDGVLDAVRELDAVDEKLHVRALRARARARWRRGSMREAQLDLENARFVARSSGDPHAEALCLAALGVMFLIDERSVEAVEALDQAIGVFRELGDLREEGRALGHLASLVLESDAERAHELYVAALAMLRQVSDRRSLAVHQAGLGVLYRRVGDTSRAEPLFVEAIRLFRQVGDRRFEAVVLGDLGELCHHAGELGRAEETLLASLQVAREVGARTGEARALATLGALELERGALDRAQERLGAALAVHRDIADRHGEARDLAGLARLHHLRRRFDAAREHYRRASQLLGPLRDRRAEGLALAWHGALEADAGDLAAAADLIDRSAAVLDGAADPSLAVVSDLLRRALDVARARVAGPEALAEVRSALEARLGSLVAPSAEARLAVLELRAMAADQPPASPQTTRASSAGPSERP